ncbi:hypothetical protein D9613_002615 [Agrocybe pediades]|uniref:GPI mannosyltransferase 1 n=1 Tax=Agrocybe pediades TaxID=84607 RepID=A0A8H4QQA8_9AGAR|nr:hypothetical protein D9613_002615 [Agrocybe pediades]
MLSPSLSFRNVLVSSIAIRVILILYSEWHDEHSVVKYTDVDYRVFSDAAFFLSHPGPDDWNRAQGPLKSILGRDLSVGNPYTRETYRYTPLLAFLLTPNGWLLPSFGKYVFALCDIVNGILIYRLLKSEILPGLVPDALNRRSSSKQIPNASTSSASEWVEMRATIYSAVHLLNPLVFSISTRGSSESVLSLFVLLTLYASLKGHWDASAVLLGLSTHWKIYPVVYGAGCLGVIGRSAGQVKTWKDYLKIIINPKTIRFTLISAGTFIFLGLGCYAIWGYPFLYESYLYHLHRLDHRHNFSPYFYLTYLTYPSFNATSTATLPAWERILRSPLISFVPQMTMAIGSGLVFGRRKDDLVFTWFIQTCVFVIFNKVCTSQVIFLVVPPTLTPPSSPAVFHETEGWFVHRGLGRVAGTLA